MSDLARVLSGGPGLRLAVVEIVSIDTGTLTVSTGADSFSGVAYLAHVNPTVGAKAVAIVDRSQYLVIGITTQ